MSLLFIVLSRLVVAFLPRSKHLLVSWLQSTISSDFGAQKNKVTHCFHHFPIYLPLVQLSHPYMTTGKTIALTIWTFVNKVMSLFFNMLPRFVITFLPRSKRLLISWLQSPSAVILEPQKTKSDTVYPSISHEVMEPDAMIIVF